MKSLRVLIIEDSEDDVILTLRQLRRGGYNPFHMQVDTAEAMAQALDSHEWDLVLSDHAMPCFSSEAALAVLKNKGIDLPFIIVSGTIGEEVAVAAMKAGAHDYLMKSNLARLAPAVERELREADERRARKQADEALRRANRSLLALKRCADAMARATCELDLLNRVCAIIVELGGAKMAWVGFAEDDEAKTLRPVASAGDDQGYLDCARITWADHARGRVPTVTAIQTREVDLCQDIAGATRTVPWRKQQLQRGYASSIALPLIWENRCLGALTIYSPKANAFSDQEVDLLKQLAGDLTYGIVSLRARAEREELQQDLLRISEREKQLISQELHDGLCQNLTGTALIGSLLARRLTDRDDHEAVHAKRICELLNATVNEARNLSHGLHPVGPEGEGLMNTLAALAGTVTNLFHLRCTFRCPEPVILANETASTHLLRIAQESINNARKHGEAESIAISLLNTPEGIKLTIRDNGIGIPSDLPKIRGMGLKSMNYRATEIGASLSVRRASKKGGTVVTCVLPARG